MIYIKLNDSKDVEFIHYKPFDPIDGLGISKDELILGGVFVDAIPEPIEVDGKTSVLKYDHNTESMYYEYIERPLTQEEELKLLKEQNAQLKSDMDNAIMELSMLIAMGGNV